MKLTIEFVPDMAGGKTLYRFLTAKAWNEIRKEVLSAYDCHCSACGVSVGQLNCHERWEYDDETLMQRLVDIVPLCQLCHLVTHMNERGASREVLVSHFMQVNDCSLEEFEAYYQQCQEEVKRRNAFAPDQGPPPIWEQDWGKYAAVLAQKGKLKGHYEWRDGMIISIGLRNVRRRPASAVQVK